MRGHQRNFKTINATAKVFLARASCAAVSEICSAMRNMRENLILDATSPAPSTERHLSSNPLVVAGLACRVEPKRTGISGTQTSRMVDS